MPPFYRGASEQAHSRLLEIEGTEPAALRAQLAAALPNAPKAEAQAIRWAAPYRCLFPDALRPTLTMLGLPAQPICEIAQSMSIHVLCRLQAAGDSVHDAGAAAEAAGGRRCRGCALSCRSTDRGAVRCRDKAAPHLVRSLLMLRCRLIVRADPQKKKLRQRPSVVCCLLVPCQRPDASSNLSLVAQPLVEALPCSVWPSCSMVTIAGMFKRTSCLRSR